MAAPLAAAPLVRLPDAAAAPAVVARTVGQAHVEAPQPQPPRESLLPGTDRPRLRLMRSEAQAAGATVPAPAATRGPASATAQRLARATAGAIEYEDDGRVSVLFPPPGSVFASPGGTVARAEAPPGEAPAEAPPPVATATTATATAAAAPAGTAAPAALDRDELYADFMRRLRRDVLEQREQLGDL